MKYLFSITAMLAASLSVCAKDKITPLTADAAAQIQNKTFIVTRHAKPDFTAMTAGKASFGLFGAVAMVKEGNEIVQNNRIPDNAEILEEVLVPLLIKKFGLTLVDENANHTAFNKPEEIAKEQNQGDYILDIASINWMSLYYPGNWSEYHTFYMGQARLIERASGKQLSSMTCVLNGRKDKNKFPPSNEDMLADNAQLLKDMLASQGWSCAQRIAKDEFGIADIDIPKTPVKYVDPQADFAAKKTSVTAPAIVPAPAQ